MSKFKLSIDLKYIPDENEYLDSPVGSVDVRGISADKALELLTMLLENAVDLYEKPPEGQQQKETL